MHLTEEELREHLKQKITLRAVICIIYDNEGNLNDCESKKNMLDFLIVLYR